MKKRLVLGALVLSMLGCAQQASPSRGYAQSRNQTPQHVSVPATYVGTLDGYYHVWRYTMLDGTYCYAVYNQSSYAGIGPTCGIRP